jgi:hypothetical protein
MVWLRAFGGVIERYEEILHPLEEPIGPSFAAAVERADEAAQWQAADAMKDQYFAVPDDVTEERHQRPGAEHPSVILLRQGAGFRRSTILTSEAAGFVSACDGDLNAGVIAQAIATLSPDIAEEDEAAFEAFAGTTSLPFKLGQHRRVAIKVIDPRGNEVMGIKTIA